MIISCFAFVISSNKLFIPPKPSKTSAVWFSFEPFIIIKIQLISMSNIFEQLFYGKLEGWIFQPLDSVPSYNGLIRNRSVDRAYLKWQKAIIGSRYNPMPGLSLWSGLEPDLEKKLEETGGIPSIEEQIACFTPDIRGGNISFKPG